ncbi:MAG: universal stress protein [Bacteroidota bacterium]
MKTYLFATDFSVHAREALQYAIPFVKNMKGDLLLYHTYDFANPYVEVPPYLLDKLAEDKEKAAIKELKALQAFVAKVDPELPCTYTTSNGPFVSNLIGFAKEEEVAAILMGTKGASGLKKIFVGSNTADVLGNAQCPVIAIPEKTTFSGIKKIVYAADFRDENGFILRQLRDLAKNFDAEIEILYVVIENSNLDLDVYDWYQVAVKEILLDQKVSFKVAREKDVRTGISKYIAENPADLLVMATHKMNWFKRLFKPSEAKNQAYHIQAPMLVFHAGVEEKALLSSYGS